MRSTLNCFPVIPSSLNQVGVFSQLSDLSSYNCAFRPPHKAPPTGIYRRQTLIRAQSWRESSERLRNSEMPSVPDSRLCPCYSNSNIDDRQTTMWEMSHVGTKRMRATGRRDETWLSGIKGYSPAPDVGGNSGCVERCH